MYHNIMPDSDALPILIEDTYGWFQGEAVESRNKKDGYENVRKVGIFHLSESVPEDPAILQWSKTVEKELSLCQQDYIKHYAIDTLAKY